MSPWAPALASSSHVVHANPVARAAVMIIAILVIVALLAVTLADLSLEVRGRRTIGQHIQRWARRYVVVSTILVALVGALMGHFFWQPPTPP